MSISKVHNGGPDATITGVAHSSEHWEFEVHIWTGMHERGLKFTELSQVTERYYCSVVLVALIDDAAHDHQSIYPTFGGSSNYKGDPLCRTVDGKQIIGSWGQQLDLPGGHLGRSELFTGHMKGRAMCDSDSFQEQEESVVPRREKTEATRLFILIHHLIIIHHRIPASSHHVHHTAQRSTQRHSLQQQLITLLSPERLQYTQDDDAP
jgi:hypothetical protein